MMKPAHLLVAVLLKASFPVPVASIKCGKWYSNDCLADEDIRYDPSASDSFLDQHPFWKNHAGFFRAEARFYNGVTGLPAEPTPWNISANTGFPWQQFPHYIYYNITIVGSRLYNHAYQIFPPPSQEFCSQTFQEGLAGAPPGAPCGLIGSASGVDFHATTSYERDGSMISLPTTPIGGGQTGSSLQLTSTNYSYGGAPVDDKTFYASFRSDSDLFLMSSTFLDSSFTRSSSSSAYYTVQGEDTQLDWLMTFELTRVESKQAWMDEIRGAYARYGVPDFIQKPVPMTAACLQEPCPTEQDDWCQMDPECSESPYQEPDGSVRAGPIAGFVIAFFVLVLAILYLLYRHRLAQQAKRFRTMFARRIAETIRVQGSRRIVTPEALAEEFKEIDKTHQDGYITKDELWDFISSGHAGEVNESDFNALFAALDLDKDGKVDFLEFCAFMGRCDEEYEEMKGRKSVLAARPSMAETSALRLSMASNTARRLSSLVSVDPAILEEVEEAIEEEVERENVEEVTT